MAGANNCVFKAEAIDIFSGDDLTVMVDLGVEGLYKKQRIRLAGVDTPNAVGVGPETEAGRLRTHVRNIVRRKELTIYVKTRGANVWAATVEVDNGDGTVTNLNDDLIAQGYSYKRKG